MLVFLSHRNHSIFLAGESEGAEVQLSAVALIEIVNLLVGSGIGSGTSGNRIVFAIKLAAPFIVGRVSTGVRTVNSYLHISSR
jgi:hypothetical protein